MGFCIYCNQNVHNNTSCPKCYRTIPVSATKTSGLAASKINSMFPNQNRLNKTNTDKWQDTYGKKAIFNSGLGSTATTPRPRQQRNMPQFTNPDTQPLTPKDNSSNMKSCVTCQRKQTSWTDLNNFSIYNSVYYCKPCLAQKLACPGCSKPVNRTDTQTFFNEQIWHSSCFQCNHCQSPLKPMLAASDTEGKPCCRSCQLKDASKVSQMPSPGSPSISTPVLSSLATSRSTLTSSVYTKGDNPYFRYQKSRRASMFSPSKALPEEEQDETKDEPSPSPTVEIPSPEPNIDKAEKAIPTSLADQVPATLADQVPTTPADRAPSTIVDRVPISLADRVPKNTSLPKSINELDYKRTRALSTPGMKPASSTIIEPKKTESSALNSRRRKVVKKPCKECGQHVSKKDYRGLRIPSGEVLCYHTYCLFCAKCNQNFDSLEFRTDGKNFYHTECPDLNTPSSPTAITPRQNSPLSEEEEPYPQTPPSHNSHFDVVSSSPTDVGQLPLSDDLPKMKTLHARYPAPPFFDGTRNTIEIERLKPLLCNLCSNPVTDTFLELQKHYYHEECLLCAGCNKTVPTDRELFKFQNKLYCDHCTPDIKKKQTTSGLTIDTNSRGLSKINIAIANHSVHSPSDFFKSRKKSLPQLGGVRVCDGCHKSMPFSDTQPGPNASRWHKKCLRCTGCKKQLDSGATMTLSEKTGLHLVHCRDCLDETPKPRFVR